WGSAEPPCTTSTRTTSWCPRALLEPSGCPRPRRAERSRRGRETSEHADTDVADVASVSRFSERSAGKTFASAPTTDARQVNSSYHHRVVVLADLEGSTSSQLQSMSLGVIIPVGSTEQHGPHLPLGTDTRIATAVAREAAARLAGGDGLEGMQAAAYCHG